MIADTRIADIRSLTVAAQQLTAGLMGEIDDPVDPDFQDLRTSWDYQRRVINKMNRLEAK